MLLKYPKIDKQPGLLDCIPENVIMYALFVDNVQVQNFFVKQQVWVYPCVVNAGFGC